MRYKIGKTQRRYPLEDDAESVLEVCLFLSSTGEVRLQTTDGWDILYLTKNGNLRLCSDIEKGIGLDLDSNGRIVLEED